jgi:uncharacterized membrane protein YhaH (DUF805 family)
MLRYSLIYGAICGVIIIAMIVLTMVTGVANDSVVLGYLIMLAVLSLLFVGVKRYRDIEQGGVIRFVPALGLGLGIAVIAGVAYVFAWEGYLAVSGSDYMAAYFARAIAEAQASGAPDAAAQVAEIAGMRDAYANPIYRFGMTFMEVFPVGVLVAVVSAALLRNPRVLPARAA